MLIDPRPDCFNVNTSNNNRSEEASHKYKNRSVTRLLKAIINPSINQSQQVLSLRKAASHPTIRVISKSAGIVDHTYFSDGKQQYSAVVNNNME